MISDVEILPLTPLAQGLAFESLAAERGSPYCQQLLVRLIDLDPLAFRAAVDSTFAANPQLLISVEYEDLPFPTGILFPDVVIPWHLEDWRGSGEHAFMDRLSSYLDADRARGFELTDPPLVRAALIRQTDSCWQFCLTYHHLLMDGWSSALIFEELAERYAALRSHRLPHIPPRTPYSRFVEWMEQADHGAAAAWWADFLEDAPATLLPLASAVGARRTGTKSIRLSAERWENLKEKCRQNAATPAAVTAGLWAILLARLLGEYDVVFGMTHAGRPEDLPGADNMVGLFINTVPMRVRFNEGESISCLCSRVLESMMKARQHGYLPLSAIQSQAGPSRAAFDTLVVFENYPAGSEDTLSVLGVAEAQNREESHYPCGLILEPHTDGLDVALHYDGGRISDCDAALLMERYEALLAAFASANALDPIYTLDHRATRDRQANAQLAYRQLEPDFPLLGDVFARTSAKNADRIAIKQGAQALTYAQLAEQVGDVANGLRRRGIGPRKTVGIAIPPGIDRYIALLATFVTGGCAFVVDANQPKDRLAEAERLTNLALMTTTGEGLSGCDADIQIDLSALAGAEAQRFERPQPSDLAYVILTSGSTGTPKPVGVPYEAIGRFVACHQAENPPADVVLNMLQLHFDASYVEVSQSLLRGATLVIPSPDEDFQQAIEAHGVTSIATTPSILATLDPERSISLQEIKVGGESLPADLAERWLHQCDVTNCYGPTEATVYATAANLSMDQPVSIGRPLPFASAYVLTPALTPVGINEPGELYLAGPGLAAGYVGMPGHTARSFIPDPFGEAGTRMYRTGDFVRINNDGTLHFIGRRDGQVKLRGLRVELQEIEITLTKALGCSPGELALIPVPGPDGRSRLVVCTTLEGLTLDLLLENAGTHLARAFHPQALLYVASFPVSRNGKLDRKSLASAAAQADLFRSSHAATFGSATEKKIAAIFAEALGVDSVSPHEDFFQVGGDSIVALQAASIARRHALDITPAMILELRTPGAIATALAAGTSSEGAGRLVALEDGKGPPVVLVSGAGGGPEAMLALAAGMAGRKVLAFKPSAEPQGLQELANQLAAEIQALASTEPPIVVGHSFGAYIAAETIRRLHESGVSAHFIAIDAVAPLADRERPEVGEDGALLAALADLASEITGLKASTAIDRASVTQTLRTAGILNSEAELQSLLDQTRQNMRENQSYVAEPLPVTKMLVIRAAERGEPLRSFEPPAGEGEDWGWSQFLAADQRSEPSEGAAVVFARGNHISMLRGDAGRAVGRMIQTYIDFELCEQDPLRMPQ